MSSSILVIGAGTFGLSIALELARNGHKDITCLDKYPVPSPIAAGNDSNKIINYGGIIDPNEKLVPSKQIRAEAIHCWATDPIYSPYYHPVGFIYAACSDEALSHRMSPLATYLDGPQKIAEQIPVLTGPLTGWRGVKLNPGDGWVHARDSLKSVYEECKSLGVKFIFGSDGEIISLSTSRNSIAGVISKSGKEYKSDKVILAAGPNAATILDFKFQLEAKGFTLAHIKVSDEEARRFRNLPVIYNAEQGFYFEPDENNEVKICNEFPGYTHLDDKGESIPFFVEEIPLEAAKAIRQFLRETMPEFADREFVKTRTCWCTDSPDRQLIMDRHPDYANLFIASGDSGLSFMLMPVIGKYMSKLVRGEQIHNMWRWRPESASSRNSSQARYGGEGVVKDLKEIRDWVSATNPEPHDIFFHR
ncbi:hypothetical protein KL905_003726 [Ogataea polymorpha]|nr:hypothetical protein KL907_003289 [Ogataea polymorpha]KAG7919861.1 hypothetical protein KL905_003726 [Ogataea polymorpha]